MRACAAMQHDALRSFVITLDGPAASGKGTLARAIADHYGFAYLDTGVLYRGVARVMLDAGLDVNDPAAAEKTAREFELIQIEDRPVRTKEVGAAASVVAAIPGVRAALLDFQRNFAISPPPAGSQPKSARDKGQAKGGSIRAGITGAVLDGRDIGTVVCPGAPMKFFVTAKPQERAHRRWLELVETRPDLSEAAVRADLAERDARDAARDSAPMKPAPDAELLDTTDLSIDAAFAAACRIIDGVFARWSSRTG